MVILTRHSAVFTLTGNSRTRTNHGTLPGGRDRQGPGGNLSHRAPLWLDPRKRLANNVVYFKPTATLTGSPAPMTNPRPLSLLRRVGGRFQLHRDHSGMKNTDVLTSVVQHYGTPPARAWGTRTDTNECGTRAALGNYAVGVVNGNVGLCSKLKIQGQWNSSWPWPLANFRGCPAS